MTSPTKTARVAGALYLLLLPFGIFSFFFVPFKLIAPDNISLTIHNISENILLFRLSSISHLISQVIVVFLVLSMYRLFRSVHHNRALLMVVLALLVVPISFINEVHNLGIVKLIENDSNGFVPDQLNSLVSLLLDVSRNGVLIAQIFWGMWLLPLGWLTYKSGFLPKIVGIFVIIAGLAYLFDSMVQLLSPGFFIISQFTFILEISLPFWLLIRGINNR